MTARAHSIVVTRPGRDTARPRAARRSRLLLAGAALVLGIGSCQLPKPAVPKLQAVAVENVRAGTSLIDLAVERRSGV